MGSERESEGHEYETVESGTPLCESLMLTVYERFHGVQYHGRKVTSCPGVQLEFPCPVVETLQFPHVGGVLSIRSVGESQLFETPFLLWVTEQREPFALTMQEASGRSTVFPLLV